MSRVTIKDIAKALSMHHSTVSRALRNDRRVNDKTRKVVVAYAEKNGYHVNMSALQLRGSVKNVIAVIVPNINHNFFSNIVSYTANLAVQNGYVVSVFQSNESYEQEQEIIKSIIQNNVAGVIASVSMETKNSQHFNQLQRFKIPLVLFDRVCLDLKVPKVLVNNSKIVNEAVGIMVKKGCKRIAHISGTQTVNVFKERHAGYLHALSEHQLDYHKSIFITRAFTYEEGQKALIELFNDPVKPDGILCDSNNLLIGLLLELKNRAYKIPEDVVIIGFTDTPYIEAFNPGIISIIQPDEDIAIESFKLLLKQINKEDEELPDMSILDARINYSETIL